MCRAWARWSRCRGQRVRRERGRGHPANVRSSGSGSRHRRLGDHTVVTVDAATRRDRARRIGGTTSSRPTWWTGRSVPRKNGSVYGASGVGGLGREPAVVSGAGWDGVAFGVGRPAAGWPAAAADGSSGAPDEPRSSIGAQ
jgi:hypothetical protein